MVVVVVGDMTLLVLTVVLAVALVVLAVAFSILQVEQEIHLPQHHHKAIMVETEHLAQAEHTVLAVVVALAMQGRLEQHPNLVTVVVEQLLVFLEHR
jgi:hypothetical protein